MGKDSFSDKMRPVEPKPTDYSAFAHGLLLKLPGMEVSEEKIRTFCTPCDNLGSDNICKAAGTQDQARYVDRLHCGWARVRGVDGKMTADGFIGPNNSPRLPTQ